MAEKKSTEELMPVEHWYDCFHWHDVPDGLETGKICDQGRI